MAKEAKTFNEHLSNIASNIKVIYSTLAIVIGLLITSITFIIKTNSQGDRIETLETSNTELTKQVSNLNGTLGMVNQAVQIFLENSPAVLQYKIDDLNKKISEFHGESEPAQPDTTGTDFTDRLPGQ